MKFERSETDQLILLKISGKVDLDEMLSRWGEIVESFGTKPALWNFEGCSFAHIELNDWMNSLSRTREKAEIRRGCRAGLVTGNNLNHGFLKLIEAVAIRSEHPVNLKVFEQEAEAKQWLLSEQ